MHLRALLSSLHIDALFDNFIVAVLSILLAIIVISLFPPDPPGPDDHLW